jgi:hypothetical protein
MSEKAPLLIHADRGAEMAFSYIAQVCFLPGTDVFPVKAADLTPCSRHHERRKWGHGNYA